MVESSKLREMALREEGWWIGIEEGREQGIEQGIEKGMKEAAIRMIHSGVAIERISQYTNLSTTEIEQLRMQSEGF